jgi:carboxypeptidase C (cathepsin A)
MRKSLCLWAAIILMLLGLSSRAAAQAPDAEKKPPEAKAEPANDLNPAKEESSVTDHTIKLGGQTIPYKATAGTILLKNDK